MTKLEKFLRDILPSLFIATVFIFAAAIHEDTPEQQQYLKEAHEIGERMKMQQQDEDFNRTLRVWED